MVVDSKFSFRERNKEDEIFLLNSFRQDELRKLGNLGDKEHDYRGWNCFGSDKENKKNSNSDEELRMMRLHLNEKEKIVKRLREEYDNLFKNFERIFRENKALKQQIEQIRAKEQRKRSRKRSELRSFKDEYNFTRKSAEFRLEQEEARGNSSDSLHKSRRQRSKDLKDMAEHSISSLRGIQWQMDTASSNFNATCGNRGGSLSKNLKERSMSYIIDSTVPNIEDDLKTLGKLKKYWKVRTNSEILKKLKKVEKESKSNFKFIRAIKKIALELTPVEISEKITKSNKSLWKWMKTFFEEYMKIKTSFIPKGAESLLEDKLLLENLREILGVKGKNEIVGVVEKLKKKVFGLMKLNKKVREVFMIPLDLPVRDVVKVINDLNCGV